MREREIAVTLDGENERSAFCAFVAKAAEGRNSVPRILIGTVLILLIWMIGTLALMVAGGYAWTRGWLPGPEPAENASLLIGFMQTCAGFAVMVLTIGTIWPATWLAMRLLHKRPVRTLFGPQERLDWSDFARAAIAALVAAGVLSLLNVAFDPTMERSSLSLASWLSLLLPMTALILVQTSAEEILFRGYLLQNLAHRFRSPWVWAALPALIFAMAHWSPGAQTWMNGAVLLSIVLFASLASWLVWRTGNLGAAMGFHFGNNIVALLFATSGTDQNSLALFLTRPVSDPSWTVADAVGGVFQQIVVFGLVLVLLTWRKSPLMITGAAGRQA